MTTETASPRPTHRVYAVIKKKAQEKGIWLEIGAAWPHRYGRGYGLRSTSSRARLTPSWSFAPSSLRRPLSAPRRPPATGGALSRSGT